MINDNNIHPAWTPHKSRHLPARAKTAIAAERSLPRMHWQWRRRSREIFALLDRRSVTVLPENAAGLQAAKLIAQHFMKLKVNAEPTTRANLRLLAPWLSREEIADVIEAAAKQDKPPSAAQMGRAFGVTLDEVTALDLKSFRAVTVTREGDRNRQGRRRRNAGSTGRRGRPPLDLTPEERVARIRAQAATRMRALRKKRHAPSSIREMERDEFSVTQEPILITSPGFARRALKCDGAEIEDIDDDVIELDGVGFGPPPQMTPSQLPT